MDDTVAKREARRKRILENSEQRLQRITARNNPNNFEDASTTKFIALNAKPNILDLDANGISVNKAFIEDENDALYFQGDHISKYKDDTSNEAYFGLNNEDNTSALNNSYKCNDVINDKYGCTNEKINLNHLGNHDESTEYLQERNTITYQLQPKACNTKLLSYNFLSNHISYIVLAAIVNILLMCKMDYLFGKGIIVPYFIVKLGRLCTCGNIQEPQHGSPVIAALILCNIKPALTYRFTWALSIFTSIVTDLALYIFSFTLIYYAITVYLQDFNILIASSI